MGIVVSQIQDVVDISTVKDETIKTEIINKKKRLEAQEGG